MLSASCKLVVGPLWLVVLLVLATTNARAQLDTDTATEQRDPMEEIVVIGNKSGDPIDVEAQYEAQLRARIIADYLQQQADEDEERWRKTLPTSVEGKGRIKWGYDAQAESRVRREVALTDLPTDTVKPATVFSISF